MISTVTFHALTTELWLPGTFVITLFVKVASEIQVILWLEWKPHRFTHCCTNYEACVGFMRHSNNKYYYITMNTELDTRCSEAANLLQ